MNVRDNRNACICCLRLGHKPLYKILNMEEVDVKKYDRLFHVYSDMFTNGMIARDVTKHLVAAKIIQYVTFVLLVNFADITYRKIRCYRNNKQTSRMLDLRLNDWCAKNND